MNIQQSIDEAANRGGGTVRVPAGTHRTGPLQLRSCVTLYLENGAVVLFDQDPARYPPTWTRWSGIEGYAYQPLLSAVDAEHVAIVGEGVLDGNGDAWWQEYRDRDSGRKQSVLETDEVLARMNREARVRFDGAGGNVPFFLRPPLVQFRKCSDVRIEGVTCRNSPFWNTHILYCRDVLVRGVTFSNPADGPNADGLDIDSSTFVRVSDCLFDVGDDCLCLKSGADADGRRVGRPTENVAITNCLMRNGHGGVVMGSEISGGIRNVTISNCVFDGTDRGIRIKSRRGRGGVVEDVHCSDIIMRDVTAAVVINLYYACGMSEDLREWAGSRDAQEVNETTPRVRDISFTRIVARSVRSMGAVLIGLPESPLRGIIAEGCQFECARVRPCDEAVMALINLRCQGTLHFEHVEGAERLRDGIQLTEAGEKGSMR